MDDGIEPRLVEVLDVPRLGAVVRGNAGSLPWRLVDESGAGVNHVNLWLADLFACDNSPATLRAYAYDLLSWSRSSAHCRFRGLRQRGAKSGTG